MKKPSKTVLVLGSVVASVAGLVAQEKYFTYKIKKSIIDSVSHFSKETISPTTKIEKVFVFVSPENKSIFQKYMRPVFNAAALDYEIVESDYKTRSSEIMMQKFKAKTAVKGVVCIGNDVFEETLDGLCVPPPQKKSGWFSKIENFESYPAIGLISVPEKPSGWQSLTYFFKNMFFEYKKVEEFGNNAKAIVCDSISDDDQKIDKFPMYSVSC